MSIKIKIMYSLSWTIIMLCNLRSHCIEANVVEVTSKNIQSILESNELVLLKFYTSWCRFSMRMIPIYKEAAELVKLEFPQAGKVTMGRINADEEPALTDEYNIFKYPTIKVIRSGFLRKREYRGKRSATAIFEFVKYELQDPVHIYSSLDELKKINDLDRHIACYMHDKNSVAYDVFHRVATKLNNDCYFHAGFGKLIGKDIPDGLYKIVFQADWTTPFSKYELYTGNPENFDELFAWADEKCNPLVNQLTYNNAEELTEYQLPFVILFHKAVDINSLKEYKKIVYEQLHDMKGTVIFLNGEDIDFQFAINELGKTEHDLPFIIVDNFEISFIYKNFTDIRVPGHLRQFIKSTLDSVVNDDEVTANTVQHKRNPTASQLKVLQPSKNRYSMRNRDEL